MPPKIMRAEGGFSLVQVMMAIALTSVVSVGLAQLIYNITGFQKRASVETELMDRMEDAQRGLIRSDACVLTLNSSGQQIKTAAPTFPMKLQSIHDENKQIMFSVGDELSDGFVEVKDISADLNPSTPAWQLNALMVVDITIALDLKSYVFGGKAMRKKFSITVETGPAGEVVTCNTGLERREVERAICNVFGVGDPPPNGICDLRKSPSLLKAACESVGMVSNGVHCE